MRQRVQVPEATHAPRQRDVDGAREIGAAASSAIALERAVEGRVDLLQDLVGRLADRPLLGVGRCLEQLFLLQRGCAPFAPPNSA